MQKQKSKFKIVPIVLAIGTGILLAGCSNNLNSAKNEKAKLNDFKNAINEFENSVIATSANTQRILNNYKLEIAPIEDDASTPMLKDGEKIEGADTNLLQGETAKNADSMVEKAEVEQNFADEFTLYNLSSDIQENCDRYIKLKDDIMSAIEETETLLTKVKNKEITLNSEQRMMLYEQSKQLKDLGRDFTKITAQLSHNVDDLHQNKDMSLMPLKYLVVLNNLIDGNEMMENGLHSLEQINHTFYANRLNKLEGKITYRYKKEGQPEVYKEFNLIDGKLEEIDKNNTHNGNESQNDDENVDNNTNENVQNNEIMPINETTDNANLQNQADEQNNQKKTENNNLNTEESNNSNLQTNENAENTNENLNAPNTNSNIDTFYPRYSNIDTFYNTARNGYMNNFGYGYGAGYGAGYGYNGFNNGVYGNGMAAPIGNNYGVDNALNTPNVVSEQNNNNTNANETSIENNNSSNADKSTKRKKKGLKKNVDSYKNKNTLTPAARIRAIKSKVKKIFG